jgi:two-component system sensor histidine kinase MprB
MLIATGLMVLITILTLSVATYVITARQLTNEVDRSLDARVAAVAASLRENRGFDFFGRRVRNPLGEALLPTRFDTVTQVIDTSGSVVISIGQVDLPVTERVLEVANNPQGGTARSNVTIDGTDFRMLTVPLVQGGALQLAKDVSDIELAKASITRWLVGLGILGILLTGVAAWFVARRTMRPIRHLADAAVGVASTGELDVKLEVAADREVSLLATSLNEMLTALRASRDRQQQLVQDASHELRTPLTSLRVNLELLDRPDLPAQVRTETLRDLRLEVDALTTLSAELTALATNQKLTEAPEKVLVIDLATEVADRAIRRTERKIEVVGDRSMVVSVRRDQFDRALTNLVDNALKFSRDAVNITITADSVQVTDHGPGIAEADRSRIFERFYRAAESRSLPGSGLGLAIVKQFADDHGASVFAVNNPGGGATVGIRFGSVNTD